MFFKKNLKLFYARYLSLYSVGLRKQKPPQGGVVSRGALEARPNREQFHLGIVKVFDGLEGGGCKGGAVGLILCHVEGEGGLKDICLGLGDLGLGLGEFDESGRGDARGVSPDGGVIHKRTIEFYFSKSKLFFYLFSMGHRPSKRGGRGFRPLPPPWSEAFDLPLLPDDAGVRAIGGRGLVRANPEDSLEEAGGADTLAVAFATVEGMGRPTGFRPTIGGGKHLVDKATGLFTDSGIVGGGDEFVPDGSGGGGCHRSKMTDARRSTSPK